MVHILKRTCTAAAIALVAPGCANGDDGERVSLADAAAASGAATTAADGAGALAAPADTLVVYKTPTCGCCTKWIDHVEENGFAVVSHDLNDLSETKRSLGVPAGRASCHTATVSGYTIEGHVPADLIRKLIAESPAGVRGLAVPGMPMGSPGMEGLYSQPYDVLSFNESGDVAVYAKR